ncbi:MAG: hypothetical protein R2911_16615 [Caldilineaceae bacterium]
MNNPRDSSKPQNQLDHQPEQVSAAAFPSDYELRISGRISTHAAAWFEGMTITIDDSTTPPQTIIRSRLVDQAALYGLISRGATGVDAAGGGPRRTRARRGDGYR